MAVDSRRRVAVKIKYLTWTPARVGAGKRLFKYYVISYWGARMKPKYCRPAVAVETIISADL